MYSHATVHIHLLFVIEIAYTHTEKIRFGYAKTLTANANRTLSSSFSWTCAAFNDCVNSLISVNGTLIGTPCVYFVATKVVNLECCDHNSRCAV